MYSYGVDVGGTTIKMGFAQVEGTTIQLLRRWEIPTRTDNNGAEILNDIAVSISKDMNLNGVMAGDITGIGLGVPGPVLPDGTVNKCVNLGWGTFNVEEELYVKLGLRVTAGNDANVAALGEMAAGAGRGFSNIVMVTLGTGVGGGVVIDGRILRGATGGAGELGHFHVNDAEAEACTCGGHGCLEQYASARGIAHQYEARLGRGGLSGLMGLTGFTCEEVFKNARNGNEKALATIDQAAKYLGQSLAHVAGTINPEAFIIGGGVSAAGDFLLDRISENYRKYAFHACRSAKVLQAELGGDAGLYGAAFMATLD